MSADKIAPQKEVVVAESHFLPAQGHSPTAASAHNRLFGKSGMITYLVEITSGLGGKGLVEVEAESGDDAATKAHQRHPGGKVTYVGPKPQNPREGFYIPDEAA